MKTKKSESAALLCHDAEVIGHKLPHFLAIALGMRPAHAPAMTRLDRWHVGSALALPVLVIAVGCSTDIVDTNPTASGGVTARGGGPSTINSGGSVNARGGSPSAISSGGSVNATSAVIACPATAPTPGTHCAREGLRCNYGATAADYLCTGSLEWTQRVYAVPTDTGVGGAATSTVAGTTETVDCSSYTMADCPPEQCGAVCCPGGPSNDTAGCAGCCGEEYRSQIAAADCPLSRCALITGCDGIPLCISLPVGSPPACGQAGYFGGAVACCEGLSLLCGAVSSTDGSCAATSGAQHGRCLAGASPAEKRPSKSKQTATAEG